MLSSVIRPGAHTLGDNIDYDQISEAQLRAFSLSEGGRPSSHAMSPILAGMRQWSLISGIAWWAGMERIDLQIELCRYHKNRVA